VGVGVAPVGVVVVGVVAVGVVVVGVVLVGVVLVGVVGVVCVTGVVDVVLGTSVARRFASPAAGVVGVVLVVVVVVVGVVAVGVVVAAGVVDVPGVPVVAGVVVVAGEPPAGRFGYTCASQHELVSGVVPGDSPICGDWSNVSAISPSALYAGDCSISESTVLTNASAGFSPAGAPGAHGVSLPLEHGLGTM
jgi:hypothetical protein